MNTVDAYSKHWPNVLHNRFWCYPFFISEFGLSKDIEISRALQFVFFECIFFNKKTFNALVLQANKFFLKVQHNNVFIVLTDFRIRASVGEFFMIFYYD